MLDDTDFYRRVLLAVAQLDLERFVNPLVAGVHAEIRLLALADEVEGIAGGHADGFVARRVVNRILADELQLAVGIAAVESQLARRQRDAELVRFGVNKLALDENFFVSGVGAVFLPVVQPVKLIACRTVINVNRSEEHTAE